MRSGRRLVFGSGQTNGYDGIMTPDDNNNTIYSGENQPVLVIPSFTYPPQISTSKKSKPSSRTPREPTNSVHTQTN